MKKVVITNQISGYLMIDIANRFVEKGYDTTLITGSITVRDVPLDPAVKAEMIKFYDRRSNGRRLISWLIGSVQIFLLLLFKYRKHQILFVSNPPFAPLFPLLLRNRFSLLIFDVFPDAFVEYGMAGWNSLLVRFWTWANRKVFKRADQIFTLTKGMRSALSRYIEEEKIKIVPLWTTNEFLKPVPKEENPFVAEHHLQGKFIVLYSGNFGIAHQVEQLLEIAAGVKDSRVMFVIIGGGPTEDKIKAKCLEMQLQNCLILPWQDVSVLPYSLASADLSVVTLSENATNIAIPSKLFNYMSVGAPVLCITGKGSDLEKIIHEYKIGRSFTPDQNEQILGYISEMLNNSTLYQEYRSNSLKASTFHTHKNVDIIADCYV